CLDLLMGIQHRFDFLREELHAAHIYDRLRAPLEEDVAILITHGEVACGKPAILQDIRTFPPRDEGSVRDARGWQTDLPDLPGWNFTAVFATEHHADVVRFADAQRLGERRAGIQHRQPALDDAEPLRKRDAIALMEGRGSLLRQRSSGGDRETQRG